MANTTVRTSTKGSLNWKDILKGSAIAAIGATLTALSQVLNSGSLSFDWKNIAVIGGTAGMAYLLQNFSSASKIIISNPDHEDLQAIKDGAATVNITTGETSNVY